MKKSLLLLFSAIVLSLAPVIGRAEVSVGVFYDSLDPYGDWVEVADYGYCWTPRKVAADWRPYTEGEWAYTDAGWTWVSDEPYGWAVYHYGRWLKTETVGWAWVPGEEWGPAWVSWRRSPKHVGWAPLPPEVRFSASVAISRNVDVEFDIGPAYYSFVTVRNFGAQRLRPVIIEPSRNVTIINETRNITNITYVNQTVINRGPEYEVISRETERPIRRLTLNRRTDFSGDERAIQGSAKITGDSLEIPAPRIVKAPDAKPKKVSQKIAKEQVNRGWKEAGSPEEITKVRAKMKKEESEPEAVAADPKAKPVQSTEAAPVDRGIEGKPKMADQPNGAAKGEPNKTDKPDQGKPSGANKRDNPETPVNTGEPAKTATPDQPREPVKGGKPDKREPRDNPTEPDKAGKPGQAEAARPEKVEAAQEKSAPADKPSKKSKPEKTPAAAERERPANLPDEPARKPMKKDKPDVVAPSAVDPGKPDRPEPSREKADAPKQKEPKAERRERPETAPAAREPAQPERIAKPEKAPKPAEVAPPASQPQAEEGAKKEKGAKKDKDRGQ